MHIFKRVLTLFFFIAISSGAHADVFAGYDVFCGLPVVVGPNPQEATAETNSRGGKFIRIDPKVYNNWTGSRIFTLAHECAHHLLGHTSELGKRQRFEGGPKRQELQADCWAAKELRKSGHDFDIAATASKYSNRGHFSVGGYPSGNERAENIEACIASSDSENSNLSRGDDDDQFTHRLISSRGDDDDQFTHRAR